ncbi:MAG: flagellin [Clostridiales bacterium]|jgi:flagellin|nr:flagellin [Clostridiales bacterium]
MVITNNIPALTATRNLNRANSALSKAANHLSSGYKINSAADDAAGLAIANKLRLQGAALHTASQNSLDGVSLIQTAEGALSEVHSILQRMRELAVQSANDTLTRQEDGDREKGDVAKVQKEIDSLLTEITAISSRTEFNRIKILSGELYKYQEGDELIYKNENPNTLAGFSNDLTLQIGPNQHMELNLSIPKFTSRTLGLVGSGVYEASGLDSDHSYDPDKLDYTRYDFLADYHQSNDGILDNVNFRTDSKGNFIDKDGNPTTNPNAMARNANGLLVDAAGYPEDDPAYIGPVRLENPIIRLDRAIGYVSELRATLGATQNRLEHTISSLDTTGLNIDQARSRIEDADMAYESTLYAAKNVISQAAISIIAQANQRPQSILQLLH